MNRLRAILAAGGIALFATAALAGGYFTNGLPPAGGSQYPTTIPLTGAETIPSDTNLGQGQNPQSEAITVNQLAGFISASTSSDSFRNALIGGDFTTNLFQRGTTSGSITTTATYTADRWIAWSGTGTAFTTIQDTTAADIGVGFKAGLKVQRTAAQTGVIPVCVGQPLESVDSYKFRGQVAELDFHLTTQANFSPASGNVVAWIVYGTGTDQSGATMAFGINAGGGGGSAWTGQTNFSATVAAGVNSTAETRYTMYASIPVTATQVGIAICFTPVGTAGANDSVVISGVQLARNPAGLPYVATAAASSSRPALAFDRRPTGLEAELQQRYLQVTTETNGGVFGSGEVTATNVERVVFPLLLQMRAVPTCTLTAGGFNFNIAGTAAATGTITQVTGTTASILTIGGTATGTAGGAVMLVGTNTTGSVSCSAEL